jgi:hypothetical protein
MCDGMIDGELAHPCRHGGPPPHEIKVCVTKKGNEAIWTHVLANMSSGRPNVKVGAS